MSIPRLLASALLLACVGGCTILSGANDLHVDDSPGQSVSATDPDAGATHDAGTTNTNDGTDSGNASTTDASMTAMDASPAVDAGPTCGDPTSAKLTSCASDAALSTQIFSCRQFCGSVGKCCSTTTCTYLGIPVAGTWAAAQSTCSLAPDYEMTSCDEAIRGQNPGYFKCCCY